MEYSIPFNVFQQQLDAYYESTAKLLNYPEMSHRLFLHGYAQEGCTPLKLSLLRRDISDEEFLETIRLRPLPIFPPTAQSGDEIRENAVFPIQFDVYVLQQFRNILDNLHSHDYFEIVYVFTGSCTLNFEKKEHGLQVGELCIIAPGSRHSIIVSEPESTILNILIRKSTFNSVFFSLLARQDLLSLFFRTMLYGTSHANYLLFFTDNTEEIKSIIKSLFLNSAVDDSYSNTCCVSMVNILFATILRNYSKTIQFYDYQMGTDFSLILQYIQNNFRQLSLRELARMFHYSEPHLSVMIKKNTGYSFSQLVTQLKMTGAVDYLLNTDIRISEVAELSGYNSPDHFSRTFRHLYGLSPVDYRLENRIK